MKVALIGYGRMGQEIEKILISRGHQVEIIIDKNNTADLCKEKFAGIDAAIEFTIPSTAVNNIKSCIDFGVPIVSGTTGWNSQIDEVEDYCIKSNGTLLTASNFSIGVNIFRKINTLLAKYMNIYSQYDTTMEEEHHTKKLDYPSGTAITLAEDIIAEVERKKGWKSTPDFNEEEISIAAIRRSDISGKHIINWESEVDTITISHTAKSRAGFALGAVVAAEFIHNKKGIYSIDDLIKL